MFFTKENITLFIAILGAVLSVGNVIYNAITRQTKLSITSTYYSVSQAANSLIQMYLHIANESVLPVSITRIQIKVRNELFDCDQFPKLVFCDYIQNDKVSETKRTFFTLDMPISLASLGATSGFVQFNRTSGSFDPDPKDITLIISTNRKNKLQLTFTTPLERTIDHLM